MADFTHTQTIEIDDQTHTVTVASSGTTKAYWQQGIAYRRLEAVMVNHPEYSEFLQDRAINGQIYSYTTLVMTVVSHDLPFELPGKLATGLELLAGFERIMALPIAASTALLSAVEPLITAQIDPKSAPPHKVADGEKKSTPPSEKRTA